MQASRRASLISIALLPLLLVVTGDAATTVPVDRHAPTVHERD